MPKILAAITIGKDGTHLQNLEAKELRAQTRESD